MSLLVTYEAGVGAHSAEDITGRVRVGSLDVAQNAEEGSVAMSTMIVDDPEGNYDIHAYRRVAIYETEGTVDETQLLFNGFIVGRRVIRGPYRTGAGRQWEVDLVDTNGLLEFRVMVGEDADRPAETDAERMEWLMSTSEMNRIPNLDFMNLTGPVDMDAADYRGQRGVDILNDCAQASGKNYFAFCIDAPGDIIPDAPGATHLWYDWADSDERPSDIRLSNDLADIDGIDTFEISLDTRLERDPSRVYSGGLGRWDGGDTFVEDLDISNEFTRRDCIVPMENVKSSAKATARINRYLASMSTEEDRITTAILLPAADVNRIREGMRCEFKATHFPPVYRNFVPQRVLQRKVKQVSEEWYLVTLTLGWGPSVLTDTEFLVPTCDGPFVPMEAGPVDYGDLPDSAVSLESVELYTGATYRVEYTAFHSFNVDPHIADNPFNLHLTIDPNGSALGTVGYNVDMGSNFDGDALVTATITAEMLSATNCVYLALSETGSAGRDIGGSTATAQVFYVSGPDPRFP
jgi:hypothetical protein